MNRRQVLAALAGAALWPLPVGADQALYLVNLVVFTCPECQAMSQGASTFERSMGSRFRYAPLPFNREAPLVRAWYALRRLENREEIRRILYDIPHVMRIMNPSIEEVIEFVRLGRIDVEAVDLRRRMFSTEVDAAMARAIRLTEMAGIATVPAFVWIREGKVIFAAERGTTPTIEFAAEVMKEHRNLSGGAF